MSKLFRGQVKISEVKEAFEEIVDRVNNIIDEYNTQVFVNHIDYTSGNSSLAPTGHTLSVGGLKQIISNMEGCVLGGKAFKVSDTKVKLSTGLLFKNNTIYKLPDSVVTVDRNTKHIYYDINTNNYSTTTGVRICDINMGRSNASITGLNDIQCEEIDKKYAIKTQTKNYTTKQKFVNWDGGFYENLDTSNGAKFVSAINALTPEGCQIRLFNTLVDEYSENAYRSKQVWSPMVYLYIPKGVANPYVYYQKGNQVSVNKTNQKVMNVTISK